jgi:RNA polymerase sigma-70 factor (ECF subfamily)
VIFAVGDPPNLPDNSEAAPSPNDPVNWNDLVAAVQRGDNEGMERLYTVFARGIRFLLIRQLGYQDVEDKIHDTFLIVVNAIRRGDLREPERLMGYVRTVVRRQVATHIDGLVQSRRDMGDVELGYKLVDDRHDPEAEVLGKQRFRIMEQILRAISRRDREILTRFYLHEQTQEQICAEMGLTETQFRLLKSRAKARFGELGRRKLGNKPPEPKSFRQTGGQ